MTSTTTEDPLFRTVTPDDAITSVTGYLLRAAQQLAGDRVTGTVTPSSLRELGGALGLMERRLYDVSCAVEAGAETVLVTDEVSGIIRCLTCDEIIRQRDATEHAATHTDPARVLFREPDRF